MNLDYHTAFVLLFRLLYIAKVCGKCYFPGELQGVWATQAAPDVLNAPIGYTMVTINANEISTWGQCYSKIDNNIILADRSGPHSAPCFRCFRLVVASVNVAALVSGGLKTCFASVEDALTTCPTTERGAAHIVLYKVRSSWGESGLQETQCPFSGIYFFSFEKGERNYRGRRSMRCEQPTSELSNCPFGFSLSLQYRDCTFEDPRTANWHCLGSWKGLDGQKYTAFLDMYSKEGDGKPKYKCGIYREDEKNRVFLSFSQDSTCTNGLVTAEHGHERYVLYNAPSSPLPDSVRDRTCRFPSNLRGQWHNMDVGRSSITYRDERSFNTLHMQCVREFGDSERYAVYTRTDCGKWFYTCILLRRRSANVMEMMFGKSTTESLHPDLCNMRQFGNMSAWVTQARTNLEVPTSCPIVGTYKGELPDAPGYCAQLYSDCTRTDLMYYAVDECSNLNAIYEQNQFSNPREVTPGVFVPPEGFDNVHRVDKLPVDPVKRGQSSVNIPREIQVGTVNLMPPVGEVGVKSFGYDIAPIKGTSVIISKKRKKRESSQPDLLYRAKNPKTTTLSFIWGKAKTTPTTNRPFSTNASGHHYESGATKNQPFGHTERLGSPTVSELNDQPQFRLRSSDRGARVWNQESFQSPARPRNEPWFGTQDRSGFDDTRKGHEYQLVPRQSQRTPQRTEFKSSRDEVRHGGRVKPFPDNNPFRPPFNRENPSSLDFRRNQNPIDRPVAGVRPLPMEQTLSGADPLGFWPSNGQRPSPEVKNPTSHSIIRNEPWPHVPRERPAVPIQDNWREPPQPPPPRPPLWKERPYLSPSLKEISLDPTPSPSRTSSNNDNNKENKPQRKPVLEEREYQCIGQWEENGHVYALTRRRDIHTYECFVGVINAQGVVYMKEAGSSCKRDIRPNDFGMRTVMKEECVQESSRSKVDQSLTENEGWRGSRWISESKETKENAPTRPPWVPSTTRPWKPITGRPSRSDSGSTPTGFNMLILNILILYFIHSFL